MAGTVPQQHCHISIRQPASKQKCDEQATKLVLYHPVSTSILLRVLCSLTIFSHEKQGNIGKCGYNSQNITRFSVHLLAYAAAATGWLWLQFKGEIRVEMWLNCAITIKSKISFSCLSLLPSSLPTSPSHSLT